MKGAGSVPTRAGGQFLAFAERDIAPPELGQVIEDAAADDSASDDKYPDVALHGIYLKAIGAGQARRFLVVRWIYLGDPVRVRWAPSGGGSATTYKVYTAAQRPESGRAMGCVNVSFRRFGSDQR